MKTILLLSIILIIGLNHLPAQTALNHKADSVLKFTPLTPRGYFNLLGNNFKEQVTAPTKMKGKQLLHLGLFAAATVALFIIDPNVDAFARKLDCKYLCVRKVSPVITNFGASYGLYTVGALEAAGLVFNDKKLIISGLLASQAMITSGVYTRIGKIVFGRARPSAAYDTRSYARGGKWHDAYNFFNCWSDTKSMPGANYDAFPSGHTSLAFSIATVYTTMYRDKPIVPIFSYTLASLVGLSRLTEHAHWGSDVFVGAALGYLCGRQVVNNYEKLSKVNTKRHKHKNISMSVNYSEKNYMAGINYIF